MKAQHGVAGRLTHHAHNWDKVTKDRWVLDLVKGYHIDFWITPHQVKRPHLLHYNTEQIVEEVRDILQKEEVSN